MKKKEAVLLNDPERGSDALLRFASARHIICACTPDEVIGALAALEVALAEGFHLAGYFSYELGYALSTLSLKGEPAQLPYPLLWFGVYEVAEPVTRSEVCAPGGPTPG